MPKRNQTTPQRLEKEGMQHSYAQPAEVGNDLNAHHTEKEPFYCAASSHGHWNTALKTGGLQLCTAVPVDLANMTEQKEACCSGTNMVDLEFQSNNNNNKNPYLTVTGLGIGVTSAQNS